jgi:phenylpropionate dioxygenase-like ring-hydroxylating dioxygenase large terminal subunit
MVVAARKYEILDPRTGELDRRIFIDQAIYDEEMEKIFGRAWLMVAHESLIPAPNDYFLSYMGEDPVIVTRDPDMQIHVLLNLCTHRGSRIVRADKGNARNFMCTYHGWTFGNDGKLGYVPGESEAYYGAIEKDDLCLHEARVDVYAGIVFACWDPEAPTLEEYLGDARWYLDTRFNASEGGMIAYGPQKWIEPVNWKTPVDNCSDNYHLQFSHFSSASVAQKYRGLPMSTLEQQLKEPNANHHVFVNGHSLTFRVQDPYAPRGVRRGVTPENKQIFENWDLQAEADAERRLGFERGRTIQLANHSLFPNTVLGFRLAHPRGPLKTEFWHFALVPRSAPPEVKNATQNSSGQFNGAAGIFEQDDIDNWRQVTEASKTPVARQIPANLSMGVGHAACRDTWPGEHSDRYISENNQRGFYQRWEEFMNADSWRDIHIDPIRATYEGTAGFRG